MRLKKLVHATRQPLSLTVATNRCDQRSSTPTGRSIIPVTGCRTPQDNRASGVTEPAFHMPTPNVAAANVVHTASRHRRGPAPHSTERYAHQYLAQSPAGILRKRQGGSKARSGHVTRARVWDAGESFKPRCSEVTGSTFPRRACPRLTGRN